MSAPVPYLFDRDFAAPLFETEMAAPPAPDPDDVFPEPDPEPARLYNEADLARVREEGRVEGRAAAEREASAVLERRIDETLARLAGQIEAAAAGRAQLIADCELRAARLAAAIVRRLIPVLEADQGPEFVAATVGRVLDELREPLALTVHVCEVDRPAIAARLTDLALNRGFAGAFEVIADPAIAAGDCRIRWQGGQAVRHAAALRDEIDAILARTLGDAAGVFAAEPAAEPAAGGAGPEAGAGRAVPSAPPPTGAIAAE